MTGTFTMPIWEVLEYTKDIGLDKYPIFDEEYRETLNTKIIRNFWNQEIGHETIDMFRMRMSVWMANHMPYYNQMYKINLTAIDPLSTVSMKSISDSTNDSESNGTVTASSDSTATTRATSSVLPQGALRPDADYADSLQDNLSKSGGKSDNTDNRVDSSSGKVINTTEGYSGHQPQLLMAARQAVLDIDLLIISALEESGLFMMIVSSPDSFFETRGYYNGSY